MKAIGEIADIVELRTWANQLPYSRSSLEQDLKAASACDEDDDAEQPAQAVFDEIAFRSQLLGSRYPFATDGLRLSCDFASVAQAYLFCLGLCWLGGITNDLRSREFEAMALSAAKDYFGGDAIRVGAPWATDQIRAYDQLLQLVADLIPELGPPTRTKAPAGGDGGWDIVVAKNFPDRTSPRVIALGNCATGRNWHTKGREAEPASFWHSFTHHPVMDVQISFLAVPFAASREEKRRKSGSACMVFDRFRICAHTSMVGRNAIDWLESQRLGAQDLDIF